MRNYSVAQAQWHEAPKDPVIKAVFSQNRHKIYQQSPKLNFCKI